MRIHLRDLETGLYAGKDWTWGNLEAAEDFSTLDEAGRKACEYESNDLAVILSYGSPECELVVNPTYGSANAGGGRDALFWLVA